MDLVQHPSSLSFYKLIFVTICCVSMTTEVLSDACTTSCTCEMEADGLLVDCSSRELTTVPPDIPQETVSLKLSSNSISSISVSDLDYLKSLQKLYLNDNSVRCDTVDSNTFRNLKQLKYLDLSDNRIRLDTNELSTLLQPLTELVWLNLADNNIYTVEQGMITIFDRLETINLSGNIFECDCDLLWLKNWLLNTRYEPPIVNGADCYQPAGVRRQQIAYAEFCSGAGTCYQCTDVSSNEDCTDVQSCSPDQDACMNVIRTSNGVKRISKGCQQLQACLNNNEGNLLNCNDQQPDTACWHCCQGDLCNEPETAVIGPIITPGTTKGPDTITGSVPSLPQVCYAEESNEGDKGKIMWPETKPDVTSERDCPYQRAVGDNSYATRTCDWEDSSGAYWLPANVDDCPTDTEILEDLADEDITEDNAEEVSEMLAVVTSNPDSLNDNDVNNAVITIEHLSDSIDTLTPSNSPDILTNVLTTVNHMVDVPIVELEHSQRTENTSSRILKTIDEFALGVQFPDTSIIRNTQAVDMAVTTIDSTNLDNDVLFRAVGSRNTNYQPELYLNYTVTITDDDGLVQASIQLPDSLLKTVADAIDRVQFVMFQDTTFFEVIDFGGSDSNSQDPPCDPSVSDDTLGGTSCDTPEEEEEEDNEQDDDDSDVVTILNSVVISASVGDLEVNDLVEPAIITLRSINEEAFNPRCVFWDLTKKNGKGGWTEKGCRVNEDKSSDTLTVCECDHLTNFAMIMDVYKDDSQLSRGHTIALSVISYIGCAVSFIALLLTLLTYTMCGRNKKIGKKRDSRSGRRDKRTKILLNLVVALLLVNFFFICGALVGDYSGPGPLCTAMAVILHYFLLSAMIWMALEAFDMYIALVKVFESYYSHYLLKMCVAGWGLPILAIAFTAGFEIENYGYYSGVCWLSLVPFYAAFLAPVCLILLFNSIVFIMVSKQLCDLRKRNLTKSESFDLAAQLRASFSITFLLGLTWILAIFAVGSADLAFSYLFAIVNSLQGFSVFFFQCILNADIRKRWYRMCCPKCAPPEEDAFSSNDATTRRITQQQKISTTSMSPLTVAGRVSQFESGHTYDNRSYTNNQRTDDTSDNTYDNVGTSDPDYEPIRPQPLPPRTTRT